MGKCKQNAGLYSLKWCFIHQTALPLRLHLFLSLPFNSVHIDTVLGQNLMILIFYLLGSLRLLYDLMTVSHYHCFGKWQAVQYNEANMPYYWMVQIIVWFWILHYHFEWAFSFRVLKLLIQSKGLLRSSSSHSING